MPVKDYSYQQAFNTVVKVWEPTIVRVFSKHHNAASSRRVTSYSRSLYLLVYRASVVKEEIYYWSTVDTVRVSVLNSVHPPRKLTTSSLFMEILAPLQAADSPSRPCLPPPIVSAIALSSMGYKRTTHAWTLAWSITQAATVLYCIILF